MSSLLFPVAQPTNLVLQSLPAIYLAISTQAMDGNQHHIQVYSDISAGTLSNSISIAHILLTCVAEWISGNNSLTAQWDTNTSSSSVIHSVQLEVPQPFSVVNNHIQDATAYYGLNNGGVVTWQTAAVSEASL